MAEDYNVRATLTAYDQGFSAAMQQANKQTGMLGKGIGGTLKQSALFTLGMKATGAAINAFSSHIGDAIKRADTLKQFPKIMSQMGFSTRDAEASVSKLGGAIEGLPTALDEITRNTQSIALITGDLAGATDTAIALNNAFLSSGAGAYEASRGLTQYTQMLSSGKVDWQSWRTLLETMGPALTKVAKSFGYTGASAKKDLYEALQSGEITFDDFNKRIIELNEGVGGFAELAKTSSTGIETSFKNIGTAITKNLANGIKTIDDALSFIKGPPGVTGFAGAFDIAKKSINDFFGSAEKGTGVLGALADFDFKGAIEGAKPYWDAFKNTMIAVGNAVLKVASFLGEHSKAITKIIPVVLGAVGAFKLLKMATNFANSIQMITKCFGKLAGGMLSKLPFQLTTTAAGEAEAGTAANASAGAMLRFAGAVALLGVGIAAAGAGFYMMATAATTLAAAGGGAIAVFFGMVAAFAVLMGVLGAMGPLALTAGGAVLMLGGGLALAGAGAFLLGQGIKAAASALPVIAESGKGAARGIKQIGKAATGLKLGSLVKLGGLALTFSSLGRSTNKVATSLRSVRTTISSVVSGFLSFGRASSSSIQQIRTNISSLKTAFNKVKNLKGKITIKAKTPHFKVSWEKLTKGKTSAWIPHIKQWAKGAIFNGPSLLSGGNLVGEAGPEAVAPIKVLQRYVKDAVMAANVGTLADGYNYGVIQVPLYINGREFARATSGDMQSELNYKQKIDNRKKGRT